MRTLTLLLKAVAPVFGIVGALHLALGVGADVLLGARLPAEALGDPALDSQNRFYGVAFSLYGVLLYLCATDLRKYATVLRCVLWVFFAAGLARLVSIAAHGLPPQPVLALLATELALPPLLHFWLAKVLAQANPSSRLAPDGARGPHRPLMPQFDPNVPMFDLFVGNDLIARLCDPRREEMFWWSYRIAPASEEADLILHDEATWKEVRFTVRTSGRRATDARTFAGGDIETFTGGDFVSYCRRESDRLSFRSLGPIDP